MNQDQIKQEGNQRIDQSSGAPKDPIIQIQIKNVSTIEEQSESTADVQEDFIPINLEEKKDEHDHQQIFKDIKMISMHDEYLNSLYNQSYFEENVNEQQQLQVEQWENDNDPQYCFVHVF